MTFFDNFNSLHLIVAHRGFRSHHPENTFSAFKASIGKCHFIELDVQMSKDNVPVVFHDGTLERTSNAPAIGKKLGLKSLKVSDWTSSQLKSLDVGSWFLDADPFDTISVKTTSIEKLLDEMPQVVMTLEEVLLHPTLNKIPINIEIKDHSTTPHDKIVTERVLDVIAKTSSAHRVLISSFNHDYLVIAKNCAPTISTAALKRDAHPQNLVEYLRSLDVAAYHPRDDIVDPTLIRQCRTGGFGVNIFTVNSKARQQELFAMGATGVITDFPEL